jgi:hypothetical protein
LLKGLCLLLGRIQAVLVGALHLHDLSIFESEVKGKGFSAYALRPIPPPP